MELVEKSPLVNSADFVKYGDLNIWVYHKSLALKGSKT